MFLKIYVISLTCSRFLFLAASHRTLSPAAITRMNLLLTVNYSSENFMIFFSFAIYSLKVYIYTLHNIFFHINFAEMKVKWKILSSIAEDSLFEIYGIVIKLYSAQILHNF